MAALIKHTHHLADGKEAVSLSGTILFEGILFEYPSRKGPREERFTCLHTNRTDRLFAAQRVWPY